MNLSRFFKDKVENAPASELLRFKSGGKYCSLTRKDVASRAASYASFLEAKGIGSGDHVGIVAAKSPASFFAFFGIFSVGAVAVPLAEELPAEELQFLFSDAGLKLVFAGKGFADKVRKAAGDRPVFPLEEVPLENEHAFSVSSAGCDDTACLIYTSGSTGTAKGVMLTHRNFISNALCFNRLIEASASDVLMSILPYWHSFALTVELFGILSLEAVLAIPADKLDFSRNMAEYGPSIILVVPRILALLRRKIEMSAAHLPPFKRKLFSRALANAQHVCRDDTEPGGSAFQRFMRVVYLKTVLRPARNAVGADFRFFISGGAPLDIDHQRFFKRIGIPVYQGYGQTETTPVISAGSPHHHRLGSSGQLAEWLFPEYNGAYTFEMGDGRRGTDLRGELLVRGDCVMKGYWKRPDETARVMRENWLHTGDIGYVDRDGFLFLFGRSTNLICLVGGEKCHPEPIEEKLKAYPLVSDCMILGEGCKKVYAVVALDEEAADGMSPPEIRDLITKASRRLLHGSPPHWIPQDFLFVPRFSVEDGLLTQTQKIKRQAILKHYRRGIEGLMVRNGEAWK